MDFVLIWPPFSLVSSYSRGGVPKKRDSLQDELGPEFKMTRLLRAPELSSPLEIQPGYSLSWVSEKGKDLKKCNII